MYRALYRKWRPQRFEDVVAQRGIVTALRNQIASGRVGHAYVKKLFVSRPDRALVRARAAQAALELALRLAQGKVPAGTQALTAAQQSDDEALAALDEVFVR